MPPNQTTYLDFTFEPPPAPFVRPDHNTVLLTQAQASYDAGDYTSAAQVLSPLAPSDPLARRLLLDCLIRLDDQVGIAGTFDPPESVAEAIALMDALWAAVNRKRLAELLKLPLIAESADGAIIEIRDKYAARLNK